MAGSDLAGWLKGANVLTPLTKKTSTVSYSPRISVFPVVLFLFVWVFPAAPLRAESPPAPAAKIYDTFTVYWENDVFARTDQDYTNGLRFTWSTPYHLDPDASRLPEWSRPWLKRLPGGDPGEARAVSLSFGQSIYTPVDIKESEPNPSDRPYGGYSYLAASFHNRSRNTKTTWEFQAGIVGPLSFAEEFQNVTHDLVGSSRAAGWDNQLKNEPALEVICERHWLLAHADDELGLSFDVIPHLGGRLGNVSTYLNLGGELRWGWQLPHNFGTCPIRPGCDSNSAFNEAAPRPFRPGLSSWHLFAAMDGRAVFHDIFLDGNTFADSQHVKREIIVADFMSGIAVQYGVTRVTYSYVLRTREFESQKTRQLFGALSFSWSY